MTTSFGALCSDFYVNQRLSLKMDLPTARETVLDLFDRIRKGRPAMDQFRRYEGELALESTPVEDAYDWLALRRTSIRSGAVNPDNLAAAYSLHRLVLDVTPYFLSISPLDVEYLELMFGFDLEAKGNHDEIVFDALLADGQLGELFDGERLIPMHIEPFFTFAIDDDRRVEGNIEVKTRTIDRGGLDEDKFDDEPISIYLSTRIKGPLTDITELIDVFDHLADATERLAMEKVLPLFLSPISKAINLRSC